MATIDILKKARIEKIEKLRASGVDPYPASVVRKNRIIEARKEIGKEVKITGRVMAKRGQGKINFLDLFDGSGKIQIVLKEDSLQKKIPELISLIDIGDFVAVQGKVDRTTSEEISVFAEDFQIISKSVLPLPDKWHGLKDIEERYRKRYLDMLLNADVRKRLELRSKIVQAIRDFLNKKDFLEIETPTLQPVYGGGFAKPFKTRHESLDADFYLRISDEMYLKRLIVGGFEKVYEITKVFRNEGVDRDHNPEFTMFEAQIAYEDYTYGMDIIEEIIEYAAITVLGSTKFTYQGVEMDVKRPWTRLTMVDAIRKYTGIDPLIWNTAGEARIAIDMLKIDPAKKKESLKIQSLGELIAFVFEETVEEKLIQPTIVYDYPIEVSPLAKKCSDPRFTQRFEMFAFGSELGNNYSELNDPIDLKKRFVEEKKREEAGFEEAHQTDYDYLEAIEHGFPPTCGIAIGIDRFVMMLTDAKNIKEVIAFPTLRPEIKSQTEVNFITTNNYFDIDIAVRKNLPGTSVGIALIKNIKVKKIDPQLEAAKNGLVKSYPGLTTEEIGKFPEILSYRKLYKQMGIDWHSRRPSPEALLRRIAQGKELYTVNTCVDAYNLIVMKYHVSVGAFDADQIEFPTMLRFANEGDGILLLGDDKETKYTAKELAYYDKKGGYNIDFNYRDAKRTMVTENTKNIWINVDGVYDISLQLVQRSLDESIKLITKYCGGTVEFSGIVK